MTADNYWTRRWRGRVPASVLLWRDMLGIGTLINVACTFLAMMAFASDLDAWIGLSLHLAPLPHNVFLLAALQRAPDRDAWSTFLAGAWFIAMLVV